MDNRRNNAKPFKVGVLPIPGFALMSYACTVEPFRAANLLSGQTLYDITHFGDAEAAESSGGASISASHRIGSTPQLDLLLVVAGGDPVRFADKASLAWLGRMARRGVRLGGVSGGPVILAKAGLMQGRRMTVHWEHAAALAEIEPGLLIEKSIYVADRDRITCGGGTAPLDMAHALISEHHGPVFAQTVTDWFLHTEIRPSGSAQRGGLIERLGTTSKPILAAVEMMEMHISDTLALDNLAQFSQVTARHLNRLFQDTFGKSTMAFYRDLRLDRAAQMISHSQMDMTEISLATGFSSSAHFSKCFRDRFDRAPSELRKQLR